MIKQILLFNEMYDFLKRKCFTVDKPFRIKVLAVLVKELFGFKETTKEFES